MTKPARKSHKTAPGGLSPEAMVELLRKRHEAGDDQALLAAVAWCLPDKPAWVRDAFVAAFKRLQSGEARDSNEAFGGGRRKKGEHSAAARQTRFLGIRIAFEVNQARQAGYSAKQAERELARAHGIGARTVAKYVEAHRPFITRLQRQRDARALLTAILSHSEDKARQK